MKDNGIFERVNENTKVIEILEDIKKEHEQKIRDIDYESETDRLEKEIIKTGHKQIIWALDIVLDRINEELKEDIEALNTLFNTWTDDE